LDEQSVEGFRVGRRPAPTVASTEDSALSTSVAEPPVLAPSNALKLQRVVGNAVVSRMVEEGAEEARSPVLDVVGRGGGQPLDHEVRTEMEGRIGHDFSDVRVHTDSSAAASAQSVQAKAYTVGNEIVFDSGHYQPGSESGRHTLAHELTHVMQQRSGPVDGTPAGGGVQLSDPSDRFERAAEHSATLAMAGQVPTATAATPGSVQREASEEEPKEDETVQGLFVQREGPEEEERPEEG
jgi:hypothetical protein